MATCAAKLEKLDFRRSNLINLEFGGEFKLRHGAHICDMGVAFRYRVLALAVILGVTRSDLRPYGAL